MEEEEEEQEDCLLLLLMEEEEEEIEGLGVRPGCPTCTSISRSASQPLLFPPTHPPTPPPPAKTHCFPLISSHPPTHPPTQATYWNVGFLHYWHWK